jgi:hypothetical protein
MPPNRVVRIVFQKSVRRKISVSDLQEIKMERKAWDGKIFNFATGLFFKLNQSLVLQKFYS